MGWHLLHVVDERMNVASSYENQLVCNFIIDHIPQNRSSCYKRVFHESSFQSCIGCYETLNIKEMQCINSMNWIGQRVELKTLAST